MLLVRLLPFQFTLFWLGMLLVQHSRAEVFPKDEYSRAEQVFRAIEDSLEGLERRVQPCLKGECSSDSQVYWIVSRPSGASRVARALNGKPAWLDEGAQKRILAAVGSWPAPSDSLSSHQPLVLRFSNLSAQAGPFLMFEYASGYPGERVGALVNPIQFFSPILQLEGRNRAWLFWSDGEVLLQSDHYFSGSQFGMTPYFQGRFEKDQKRIHRSFDQVDVHSVWRELPKYSMVFLFETITSSPLVSVPLIKWEWLLLGFGLVLVFALSFFSSKKLIPAVAPVVDRFLTSRRKHQEIQVDRNLSIRELQSVIFKCRDLEELGSRISACLENLTDCEVFFLEYDRQSGLLVGLESDEFRVPLSTMGLRPGEVLPEVPSITSAVLRRKDCSRFIAWPLMTSMSPSDLAGVFVLLNPSAEAKRSAKEVAVYIERAARYYRSVLDSKMSPNLYLNQTEPGKNV